MYLPKTYKPYQKRACLLQTDGVIRVFTVPAQNPIGCNGNLRTHFQQDALPRVPWLPSPFVDINDLRMRINLQHWECFPLAAVGVKRFIEYLAPYSARAIPLTASRIVQACLYGWALQTFQISA